MADPFLILDQDKTIKDNLLSDYASNKYEGDLWFEGIRDIKLEPLKSFLTSKKINIIFALIFLGILIIFSRVFYLQIYRGDYYQSIAEGNRIRIVPTKASRGVIYDANKNLLVRNIPSFSLFFIPADIPQDKIEKESVVSQLSSILGKSKEELKNIFKAAPPYSYESVLMEENIDYNKAILLKIKSASLPGIFLEIQGRREYLFSFWGLSHILGYTGKLTREEFNQKESQGYLLNDYIGKTGIELTYEDFLKGKNGKKKIEVDFLGKEEKVISAQPPLAGSDLILSLDLKLQEFVAQVLEVGIKKARAKKGAVIVMRVNSGEILALVSLPDYDNNLFSRGLTKDQYEQLLADKDKPLFFRAISGEYPSGSIIKPILAAGALEDEIISEKKTFLSTGGIRIDKWFFPDWKAGGHGRINVTQAIADSVNTFFYYIGGGYEEFDGLGLERMNQWFQVFGLNKKTQIDLSGEATGFLPTRKWKEEAKGEPWYIGDTYHLAIGQGDILITPLQAVNFTAAVANQGILYKPHLVKQIVASESGKIENIEPQVLKADFVSKENLAIVRQGMREAVIYGSSVALSHLPVEMAGKTGTAQLGGDKEPHAWFIGFAPFQEPEIALVIMIENGGEGSRTAVPLAEEILEWYFQNKK